MSKPVIEPLKIADAAAGLRHVFVRDLIVSCVIGVHAHEKDRTQRVRINVLDMAGRLVQEVSDEVLSPNLYEIPLTISSNGIYMVDVTVGDKHHIRRIVVSE